MRTAAILCIFLQESDNTPPCVAAACMPFRTWILVVRHSQEPRASAFEVLPTFWKIPRGLTFPGRFRRLTRPSSKRLPPNPSGVYCTRKPDQLAHSGLTLFSTATKRSSSSRPLSLVLLVKAKRVEFRMYGACSIACIFYAGFWTDVQGPWLLLTEFRYIPCTILSLEYEDGMAIVSYCDMDFTEAV